MDYEDKSNDMDDDTLAIDDNDNEDTSDNYDAKSEKSEPSSACDVRRRIEDYMAKRQLVDELGDEYYDDLDWVVQ